MEKKNHDQHGHSHSHTMVFGNPYCKPDIIASSESRADTLNHTLQVISQCISVCLSLYCIVLAGVEANFYLIIYPCIPSLVSYLLRLLHTNKPLHGNPINITLMRILNLIYFLYLIYNNTRLYSEYANVSYLRGDDDEVVIIIHLFQGTIIHNKKKI